MAVQREKINKGVNYKVVLNTEKDTDGETIEVMAYSAKNPADEGQLIGTATGKPKNKDIEIILQTSQLEEESYIVEVWIDRETAMDKFLVFPEEQDRFFIDFIDRRET